MRRAVQSHLISMQTRIMPRAPKAIVPPSRQRGVGLIEVLIAVLVMAIGLLGIAAMQATALRNSQSSLERSQAVIQSYTIYDAMRANRTQALAGAYNTNGMTCDKSNGATLVAKDIDLWLDAMKNTMGSTACGQISCAANKCTVTVQWDDSRGTSGGTTQKIPTQTYL